MSRLGEVVKKVRTEVGISQKQLAKKLGVAESFVMEVETGRKVVNEAMISRISKVLGKDLNDLTMPFEEESFKEEVVKVNQPLKKPVSEDVKEVWSSAFGSVFKTVPIYSYNLRDVQGIKQLPIISNKIEGYAQDKVLYLKIEQEDMIGFRIAQGDIAFGHITQEIENNSICLVEYKSADYSPQRVIRQIKKLDATKLLLISNKGTVKTETINVKDISVLVKLDRLEIKL
jgi:transcriptional regulator with XRE-family HTH domain